MSRFKPKRVKPLPSYNPRRSSQAPTSTEAINLTSLRDDRGNLLGYVDPDFGRLYKPNHRLSSPIVGTRYSRSHARRRLAANQLGIPVSASVATWERKLLDQVGQ